MSRESTENVSIHFDCRKWKVFIPRETTCPEFSLQRTWLCIVNCFNNKGLFMSVWQMLLDWISDWIKFWRKKCRNIVSMPTSGPEVDLLPKKLEGQFNLKFEEQIFIFQFKYFPKKVQIFFCLDRSALCSSVWVGQTRAKA